MINFHLQVDLSGAEYSEIKISFFRYPHSPINCYHSKAEYSQLVIIEVSILDKSRLF